MIKNLEFKKIDHLWAIGYGLTLHSLDTFFVKNKILDHKKVYFDKIVFKLLNLKMDSMKRLLRYTENDMADLGCHGSVPKNAEY